MGPAGASHAVPGANLAKSAWRAGAWLPQMFGPLAAEDRYSANGLSRPTAPSMRQRAIGCTVACASLRTNPKEDPNKFDQTPGAREHRPQFRRHTYLLQFIAHDMVDSTSR